MPPPASDLIGGESMGRSQSDRGPDLERKQRGSASGYVKRHVSVTSAGRRSPSRERTSDARVFLSTPLSEREIRKVSAGLAESARQMNPIEQEEYEMSLRGEGSVISGDGRRERTRSITYGQGPRISRGRIVEDGRERVVITDGEGRRREYYQTAERVR